MLDQARFKIYDWKSGKQITEITGGINSQEVKEMVIYGNDIQEISVKDKQCHICTFDFYDG